MGNMGISRRTFIAGAGMAACAMAAFCLSGCADTETVEGVVYAPNGDDALMAVGITGEPTGVNIADDIKGVPVIAIGPGAFEGCSSLKSIRPGTKTRLIENRAFAGCTSLRDISFTSALQKIGNSTFEGCTSLASIQSSSPLGSIGNRCFAGCTSLGEVELASCYGIGEEAFAGCDALETVLVSGNLRSIAANAFSGCTSLSSFTSLNTLKETEIVAGAFAGCSALEEVVFHGVVQIEKGAFSDCGSLAQITVGPESTIADGALPAGCEVVEYVDESKTVEVERGEAKAAGTGWTSNVTTQAAETAQSASQSGTGGQTQVVETAESLDPWKH